MNDHLDLKSSGDPVADRRYAYAEMLRANGDVAAAADLFRQCAELVPTWAPAWAALGDMEAERGDVDAALSAWRRALAVDAEDRLGVELRLARSGLAPAPQLPPEGWVRALFDDYAPTFDRALIERLGYAIPAAVLALLDEVAPTRPLPRVLDLGCGTGLTGEALRHRAGWLEGVDLAPGMLSQARAKGVFDTLTESEAVRFLQNEAEPYDLIVAGDMAPYLGPLDALFDAAAKRLCEGGLFLLSVESGPDAAPSPGWRLRPSLRYAHSPEYLDAVASTVGLARRALRPLAMRRDGSRWVEGFVGLFERPSRSAQFAPLPPMALSRPRARGR
ncbi:methyltransferase domain-containing protein [Limibaculum sp. M0105]|uniref:Methyltransferase domain-containing protein n=1 Tax=Thermohalobaculum xanthum TaxID=2753746 RepID=A0A8J7M3N2_9RHOB|nr:methyltransferase [Thermohalobaculum xanthum]MBK0397705.1 methyltransferase domain-containing protein [Thermohalobaculum xanthum]